MHSGPAQTLFYVPGFDRRDARRFWALQHAGIKRCSRAKGMALSMSDPVIAGSIAHWRYRFGDTQCRFVYLAWNDLVRARFAASIPRGICDALGLLLVGVGNGFWARAVHRGGGLGLAIALGFAPVALLLLGLALALIWWPLAGLALLGALCATRADARYIQHIAWGARAIATGQHPAFEQRILDHGRQLARHCAAHPRAPTILLGHSLGGALAFRIWRAAGCPQNCRIITLGAPLSLVDDQRSAFWAAEMATARMRRVVWTDIVLARDPLKARNRVLALAPPARVVQTANRAHSKPSTRQNRGANSRKWTQHFQYLRFSDQPGSNWDWLSFLHAASGPADGTNAQRSRATSPQRRGVVKAAPPENASASASIALEI